MTLSLLTADRVSQFVISAKCNTESYPCSHNCKITLLNKQQRELNLPSHEILSLLKNIGLERVQTLETDQFLNDQQLVHFSLYDFGPLDLPTSEEVLTQIFQKKIS